MLRRRGHRACRRRGDVLGLRRRNVDARWPATCFPLIDGGQIPASAVRAPAGTRIAESTEAIFQEVEDKIREVIPDKDRGLIIDNIGLPARAYNLAFADGSTIGINDGVIQVALKDGHRPTADYVAASAWRCCPPHFPKTRSISRPLTS